MNNEDENLKNFFAAYFHEDWPAEEDSPDDVVRSYIGDGWTTAQLSVLADDIANYAKRFVADDELERALFRDLGCYYQPSADGVSPREWMLHVASMIRASVEGKK